MAMSLSVLAQKFGRFGLVLVLATAGCASNPAHTLPAVKPQFGMEEILRSPVDKGRLGVDEIINALQTLYGVSRDAQLNPYDNTATPLTLSDGVTISKVFIDKGPNGWTSVNMGVNLDSADSSCLTVENAAALIGAKRASEYLGDGVGYEGHLEYSFDSPEISIQLVALHPGPHCLGAVWIYKKSPHNAR